MKFVLSFSGGKDSVLALHEMIARGHEPVALLVMAQEERSWIHGIDHALLHAISDALEIPLLCCLSAGETYEQNMEAGLQQAKALGAEGCVFGDIDVADHREWDEARCAAAGLRAVLPLWSRDREENVRRAIELGYVCLIKCIRTGMLPESFLGRPLSLALLEEMKQYNVDLCGENGEYHTVVVDGPVFHRPVEIVNRQIVHLGTVTAADLTVRHGSDAL